jgi:hypothetical protein
LLPAPTAPSEGYAGVRSTWSRSPKGLAPRFSILAHQLRRRFPSYRSLVRGARLLLDCASRGFACLSMSGLFVWPDPEPKSETGRPIKTVRCSAALLGETSLASRFAHLGSEEPREPRRARGHFLFRRLFPAGPRRTRRSFPFLPAEIGSSVPSSPFWPLPAFRRETGPSAPIT